jgi:hypothetical protein
VSRLLPTYHLPLQTISRRSLWPKRGLGVRVTREHCGGRLVVPCR